MSLPRVQIKPWLVEIIVACSLQYVSFAPASAIGRFVPLTITTTYSENTDVEQPTIKLFARVGDTLLKFMHDESLDWLQVGDGFREDLWCHVG